MDKKKIYKSEKKLPIKQNLTVNIDQHVLSGALPQVAKASHAVQGACVMRLWPVDSEATLDIKRYLYAVHPHFLWGELAMQCHLGLWVGHLAGQDRWPIGAHLDDFIVARGWYKQLLGI